jgi:hypothetical protein
VTAHRVDAALAARWAQVALNNVTTEYPYKLDQLLHADGDAQPPRSIHPLFWGSYDWHSCVHMHWTLARLARRLPRHALAAQTQRHFAERCTPTAAAAEINAFERPGHASFERPYGWGWLLALAAELDRLAHEQPEFADGSAGIAPLAQYIAQRFVDYLPRVDYPTRAGMHGNTAFAASLALDWAQHAQHRALAGQIAECARRWFGGDRRYPVDYEPGGEDFLSPGLTEAVLMQRILSGCDFGDWLTQFAPSPAALATWLTPAAISDAADPKIVHLHGLNLSRVWCWRQLLPALEPELAAAVRRAIDSHLAVSLPAALAGDYVGTHWLATFALLAVDDTAD